MKELKAEKPGLPNNEYMTLAAKKWKDHKIKQGIVTTSKSKGKKYSSESSDSGSLPDEDTQSSDSDNQKKPAARNPSLYQEFISLSIQHHKKADPKLSNMQCMKLAAEDWGKLKNCMAEQLAKKKESNPNLSERECQSLVFKDFFDAMDKKESGRAICGDPEESKKNPQPKLDWDSMRKNWSSIKKKHGIKIRGKKSDSESSESSKSASSSGESMSNESQPVPENESQPVPENEFVQFIREEISRQKELNPNLSEQQYTKDAINAYHQRQGTTKKITTYQLFVSKEIVRQRQIKPKSSNVQYMTLAAKEWENFKNEFNY